MAGILALRGAFGALNATLRQLYDPMSPPPVAERWLAREGQAYIIGQRFAAWDALPAASPSFERVYDALVGANHAIVLAKTTEAQRDALDRAEEAMAGLTTLLDATGQ